MSGRVPVVRPSIPLATWVLAGAWLASLLAEETSWRVYSGTWHSWSVVAVVAGVSALAGSVACTPTRAGPPLLAVGLVLGVLTASAYWGWWRAEPRGCGVAHDVDAVVSEDPVEGRGGVRVRVRLADGTNALLDWPAQADTPSAGARVRFRAALRPLDPADAFSRTAARRGDRVEGRAWSAAVVGWRAGPPGAVMALRDRVRRSLWRWRGPGADLLVAVVLGDRTRVSGGEVEQDLRNAGLGHLAAASALYAGLLLASVEALTRRLGFGRRTRVALGIAAAMAYVLVGGARASMVRGLLVGGTGAVTGLAGRRRDALASACAAAFLILLADPRASCDPGLALGMSVVCGIALFGRLATAWCRAVLPDALSRAARPLATAVVAQASALPLSAGAFGLVSLASPVAAVVVSPVVAAAFPLGIAGAVLAAVVPELGMALLWPSERAFALVASLAHVFAALPGAAIPLGPATPPAVVALVACAAGIWLLWPHPCEPRRARAGAALLAAVLAAGALPAVPVAGAELIVMDVGQGDAVLVRDGASAMLVDCGPKPQVLRAALARERVTRLDCVVLTHAHADHTGGLSGLAAVANVGWVGGPVVGGEDGFGREREQAARLTPRREDRWRTLREGCAWTVGRTQVTVLWPEAADARLDTNDTSVVLRLERDGDAALLLGDAEEAAQEHLVHAGAIGRARVLKVAHHGSVNGLDEPELAAQRPTLALISVGAGNDFGHPARRTLDALARAGARVRRTDREGDLGVPLGGASHGGTHPAYATIERTRGGAADVPLKARAELHGDHGTRRSQAGVPHLRRRGASARARGPPSARAVVERGRPRLQLRRVRGRVGPRRRRALRRQHAAVHVGEASRGRT